MVIRLQVGALFGKTNGHFLWVKQTTVTSEHVFLVVRWWYGNSGIQPRSDAIQLLMFTHTQHLVNDSGTLPPAQIVWSHNCFTPFWINWNPFNQCHFFNKFKSLQTIRVPRWVWPNCHVDCQRPVGAACAACSARAAPHRGFRGGGRRGSCALGPDGFSRGKTQAETLQERLQVHGHQSQVGRRYLWGLKGIFNFLNIWGWHTIQTLYFLGTFCISNFHGNLLHDKPK